jgi:hypothetical protein
VVAALFSMNKKEKQFSNEVHIVNYSSRFYSAVYINKIKSNGFIGVHILMSLLSYCVYVHTL